jgi:hypothetical protein
VSPFTIGLTAAVVVAGPPLWLAVGEGGMTGWGAVGRGTVVALACAVGAAFVMSLIHDYDLEVRRAEEKYLAAALAQKLKVERERQERERKERQEARAAEKAAAKQARSAAR